MADNKSVCPVKPSCGFCYKNLWHWYLLVATLPFFVKGVQFVLNFAQGMTANIPH